MSSPCYRQSPDEYAQVPRNKSTNVVEDPQSSRGENLTESDDLDRQQLLIECLHQFDEPVSLPDVAEAIAERETGETLADIPGEEVKEIYLSLYHHHVPALTDSGLLEYDQETDLVKIPANVNLEQYR